MRKNNLYIYDFSTKPNNMSNSRRNFIKKSAIGLSAIPTLGFISKSNKDSLSNIKSSLSDLSNNSYWNEVRNLFPTKKIKLILIMAH